MNKSPTDEPSPLVDMYRELIMAEKEIERLTAALRQAREEYQHEAVMRERESAENARLKVSLDEYVRLDRLGLVSKENSDHG